jgi:hypothetical protein
MPYKDKDMRWGLTDELRFINGIGSFHEERTPSMGTVETLLRRYRKVLEERQDFSFDKSEALLLIDHRLKEIAGKRAAALMADIPRHQSHTMRTSL